ncbi:hypothetical protein SLS56_012092 [Neofusicoccum ribis]|uniref:Uncharacterized protein n=1 Tax=Neofusicoccum ribis TaxID=45134 RepID=A0ABR3S9T8_9PEZI
MTGNTDLEEEENHPGRNMLDRTLRVYPISGRGSKGTESGQLQFLRAKSKAVPMQGRKGKQGPLDGKPGSRVPRDGYAEQNFAQGLLAEGSERDAVLD